MLNNYQYFIALAEEKNISKAAEKLFVSHQCLSKYLATLEKAYGTRFFERTPRLLLTPAGEAYLQTVQQIQLLEKNLDSRLADIAENRKGTLHFGLTDGRYRLLMPNLLSQFQQTYPDVVLHTIAGTSAELYDAVLDNTLDFALLNQSVESDPRLNIRPVMLEQLYLVISDNMLKTYFPYTYPQCKEEFLQGVDLKDFTHVPFVMGQKNLNMRHRVGEYCQVHNIELNIAAEIGQTDIHYMLTARDFAASFCWSMFLPAIQKENLDHSQSQLYAFPLKDRSISNCLMLVIKKDKILTRYGQDFIKLVEETCQACTENALVYDDDLPDLDD